MSEIITSIAGVNFRPAPAKEAIRNLAIGDELHLDRDPENPYDSNAVRVIDPTSGEWIGFIPKADNSDLAEFLDNGGEVTVTVISFLSELVPHLRVVMHDEEPSAA